MEETMMAYFIIGGMSMTKIKITMSRFFNETLKRYLGGQKYLIIKGGAKC